MHPLRPQSILKCTTYDKSPLANFVLNITSTLAKHSDIGIEDWNRIFLTRVRIEVSGRVQGVFFRVSTRDKATALALHGFVKNMRNGNVLIEAQGDKDTIDKLLEWCRHGPPYADVVDVKITWLDDYATQSASFKIGY